jgi:ubiquinone/menaquinone biosynthesis C-methylase UbiE
MVGGEGSAGGTAAGLTSAAVRSGYDASAQSWAEGPERLYTALARALLAAAPVAVAGRRVLDLGSGTGVAGRAALAAGASLVVAADLAPAMLRRGMGRGGGAGASRARGGGAGASRARGGGAGASRTLHPVAGDAAALPFRDGSFDVIVAAFCLNHMPSIVAALREARRVSPAIAASTFAAGWSHPAKDAIDEVLRGFGFRSPAWHVALKNDIEPRAGDPVHLAASAAEAGYTEVRLRTVAVETGLSTPAQLVSWRLGMAHVAPFLHALDEPTRAAVRRAAERAVADSGAGALVVPMLVLAAW